MKFGNAELKNGLLLAPMAGDTDSAMRRICHALGAELTVTEMISAKAMHYGDEKTWALARIREGEGPVSVQIFGHEPDIMAEAARMLSDGSRVYAPTGFRPASIDINMGCPVKKITANGEGSALMRDKALATEILSACVEAAAPFGIPVTVKIRAGWDADHKNAVEIARAAEAAGVAAITVHGRTREQLYAPGVDLSVIRRVKEAVSVPVIGNGDIFSVSDALRMREQTGCDGVMIARGALGNPFLFREIGAAWEGREAPPPTFDERIDTALLQLSLMVEEKGEYTAVREARPMLGRYLKGIRGSATVRDALCRIESAAEAEEILREFRQSLS